ncbi:hypothetical protein BOX15_Mlig030549g1, partial [Macrostomum lignano]
AMFLLCELKDIVALAPEKFGSPGLEAYEQALNEKLSNLVLHKVGLCCALWDILQVDEAHVFPGDARSHSQVRFRYVVFRPSLEEVLVGTVRKCDTDGVHVSLGFFDDILIPPDQLQHPSRFENSRGEPAWVWAYDTGADTGPHQLPMERGDRLRFRVVEELWRDVLPGGKQQPQQLGQQPAAPLDEAARLPPYSLLGSVNEPGLGLLDWWSDA